MYVTTFKTAPPVDTLSPGDISGGANFNLCLCVRKWKPLEIKQLAPGEFLTSKYEKWEYSLNAFAHSYGYFAMA